MWVVAASTSGAQSRVLGGQAGPVMKLVQPKAKAPLCPLRVGMGAAYGTAKSGVGIASMGVMRPELVMKSIVPVVMAGVLGIYGLIIAVIISTGGEHWEAGGSRSRMQGFFDRPSLNATRCAVPYPSPCSQSHGVPSVRRLRAPGIRLGLWLGWSGCGNGHRHCW